MAKKCKSSKETGFKLAVVRRHGKVRGYRLYTGRTYQSFHRSKTEAIAAHKQLTGVAASTLGRTSRHASKPPLKFEGVRPRIVKRAGSWAFDGVVRMPKSRGKVYLGTSANMDEVPQWVAEFKGKALAECKRTKARRMTPQDSANRMKILLEVFSGWVPADLSGALAVRPHCSLIIVNAPGVYFEILRGREPGWREALLKEWRSTPAF